MAQYLFFLVPKKYWGHLLLGWGIFSIILSTFALSEILFDYMNILGQISLIIGIYGIYFRKKKNFGSVRKSQEKFYIITIVGIGLITLFTINYLIFINTFQWVGGSSSTNVAFLMLLYMGDFFLIYGLRTIYAKTFS